MRDKRRKRKGTIYLLHFSRKLAHASHYLGFTVDEDPTERIDQHRRGVGSRLCAAAVVVGIELELVRVWKGGRRLERKLKNANNTPRYCPICSNRRKEMKCLS